MRHIQPLVLLVCTSCATLRPGGPQTFQGETSVGELRTQLFNALADVERIDTEVVALKARDVAVGGGGDSVTAWIYALIAGAGLLYPGVIRPLRLKFSKRTRTA